MHPVWAATRDTNHGKVPLRRVWAVGPGPLPVSSGEEEVDGTSVVKGQGRDSSRQQHPETALREQ
eukprot:2888338-Lingulodinium_polyedra.AAC.1